MTIENVVMQQLEMGKVMDAVQNYKRLVGCTLIEAKVAVDLIAKKSSMLKKGDRPAYNDVPFVDEQIVVPDYIEKIQTIIEQKINEPTGPIQSEIQSVFSLLSDIDEPALTKMVGAKLANALFHFNDLAHAHHPSLAEIRNGTFIPGGVVYERIEDIKKIYQHMVDMQCKRLPAEIADWFDKNHKQAIALLSEPPIRVLKDPKLRLSRRLLSQEKELKLKTAFEAGKAASWDLLSDTFIQLARLGPGRADEIEYLQRSQARLRSLGITNFATSLAGEVEKMKDAATEKFAGFVRIKPHEIALMCAKAMKCEWGANPGIVEGACILNSYSSMKFSFWAKGDDLSDKPCPTTDSIKRLLFAPHMYPLNAFGAKCPERVRRIIEATESHPDANGCALFDQFWVIVPTLVPTVACVDPKHRNFRHRGKSFEYGTYADYKRALDMYLTDSGQIFPVVLGENISQKKCYFICFWA